MNQLILPGKLVPKAATPPSDDKTDIIMACREIARGIEQGHPDILALIQMLGTELLVYALKYGPALEHIGPEKTEALVRAEIMAVVDMVARIHENRAKEADLLEARLMRLFDPTLAFNEAINRAITAKKEAKDGALDAAIADLEAVNRPSWHLQIASVLKALRAA